MKKVSKASKRKREEAVAKVSKGMGSSRIQDIKDCLAAHDIKLE